MKQLKSEEELGRDRNLEFETDDEENQPQSQHSSSSSLSSGNRSLAYDDAGERHGSYQPSWPQSFRQSVDMMSSVISPSLGGFIAGSKSSLFEVGGSFVRSFCSTFSDHPPPSNLSKPLIIADLNSSVRDSPRAGLQPPSPHFPPFSIPSFAKSLPPPHQCATTTQAIINGINMLCGVGLLATPYALKEGGWLGISLLFMLALISLYTGILLKKCLDSSPGLQTYPDIGQAAFGMPGRLFVSVALYLDLYACCVEYITLVGDNLAVMFPGAHLNLGGLNLNSEQLFALATAIAVLPTVWLRDLSLLSYLSGGGVIATIVVVICLLWVGVVDGVGFHRGGATLDLVNLPVALGLYGFCYSGHSVFPNIYSSMKTREHFPMVLLVCFSIATIIYAGVATSGFLMFGESVKSQFTLNMPGQFLSSKVAIWTTVVNPLSKYALTMTPVALSIEELLPSYEQSHITLMLIRTMLVFSTLLVALTVPFFGLVMALLGSVFAMLMALILPCACYLSIHRNSLNFLQVTACILVLIVGVSCSCIGSYSSIKNIVDKL